MAKKTKKPTNGKKPFKRRVCSKADDRELKGHSKAKTTVARISRAMKQTVGALRQQAMKLGIGLGHRR